MALNRRQRALYKHLLDVWSVTRTVTAGKPSGEIYTLIATNVPCIYEYTPNVDIETQAGRIKEFTLLTTDKIHMEASVPVMDQYLTVNVTMLADASRSHSWGEVHRMLGAPTIHDTLGRRHANKLMIEAMTMEHPPDVIKSHYSL